MCRLFMKSNNIEAALEKLNNVTKMWDSYKKILLITVNSNKVNELNLSFSKLSPFIESNSRGGNRDFKKSIIILTIYTV